MKKKQKIQILLGCVCLVLTFAICIQLKTIENANKVVGSSFTENELRDEVLRWKEKYDNMVRETERAEKSLEEYREKASQDNAVLQSYSLIFKRTKSKRLKSNIHFIKILPTRFIARD